MSRPEDILNLPDTQARLDSISSCLFLKSSPKDKSEAHQALDKQAVLRRIRRHKSLIRVKTALQAMLASRGGDGGAGEDYIEKWLIQNDGFSFP